MPSSPHWYDRAAFSALVHSHIRETERTGVDVPLGEFITRVRRPVGQREAEGDPRGRRRCHPPVRAGRARRRDRRAARRDARHAKPTPPWRLGPVGARPLPAAARRRSTGCGDSGTRPPTVTVGGVPWIIEVAVADTVKPGRTWFACNHAPAFGDPLGRTFAHARAMSAPSARRHSSRPRTRTSSSSGNRAAVVHVICAAPQFVDKGKVALVVPPPVADAAATALDGATKTLRREAEQRRKDARKAERAERRARDEAAREHAADQWTIKEAVFEVLPEAKAAAGHIVAARTLYYKVRPLIQQYTDKELDYDYFSQTLLPEYERTVAPLPGLYYEARGALHHPHDDRSSGSAPAKWRPTSRRRGSSTRSSTSRRRAWKRSLRPTGSVSDTTWPSSTAKGIAVTACRELLARSRFRDDEDLRPARRRHQRVQHRPHPRGGDPAHAEPQHRCHRPGFDGAAGHRIRAGDREVHPPQGAAGRPGTRRGRARMVHRRTDTTPGTASRTTNAPAAS